MCPRTTADVVSPSCTQTMPHSMYANREREKNSTKSGCIFIVTVHVDEEEDECSKRNKEVDSGDSTTQRKFYQFDAVQKAARRCEE